MKYRAILFDADGVIIKSKYLFSEQLAIDYGVRTEKMQSFFTGIFRECTLGKADLKKELAKVINGWGWKGTVEELLNYWFTKGTQIDQELVDFIGTLRRTGVRCFMTTDQEKYRGEHLRNTLGKGRVFEQIFFSAEIGYPKMDMRFMEVVYQTINEISSVASSELIMKNEILFIDDDKKNVEAVNKFGFDTHRYQGLGGLKGLLAE